MYVYFMCVYVCVCVCVCACLFLSANMSVFVGVCVLGETVHVCMSVDALAELISDHQTKNWV